MTKTRVITTLFCWLLSIQLTAQVGNEWIDFSQQYYEFPIIQNGVYRIDHSTMTAAGIPASSIDPQDFQVFGKERELFLYVEDGGDGSFDAGDYVEFYAEKNNAWLDSLVYDSPGGIGNPHYSLYNDTLHYFLTWTNGGTTRRMASATDVSFSSYTPRQWVWKESWEQQVSQYAQGRKEAGLSLSFFTRGEGWYSDPKNALNSTNKWDIDVSTPLPYTGAGAPPALIRTTSVSASNATPTIGNHHLQVRLQYSGQYATLMDTVYTGYDLIKGYMSISPDSLSNPTRIRYQLVNDLGVLSDQQQIGLTTIIYPRQPDANGGATFRFDVPFNTSEAKSLYEISNFTGSNPLVYILNDSMRRVTTVNNGTWDMLIPNSNSGVDQQVLMVDETQIQTISSLTPINGNGGFTDFSSLTADSAFIIITHPSLMSAAQQYANYRQSAAGGSHDVVLVNVNELYHQYGGGVYKHALGIKRFVEDMLTAWPTEPEYLFLIGKSVREATESTNGTSHGTRKSTSAFNINLVPSFGYPSSDVLLTAGLNGNNTFTPAVATGRLTTTDTSKILNYLDKVMDYEANQANPVYTPANKEWMKQILHFSGGSNSLEHQQFQYYLNQYADIAEDTLMGATVDLFAKTSAAPIDPVDFNAVQEHLEEGVSLMTFFGHASVGGFDQNIDDPENWNNQGKYPVVIGNACYTGDIHEPNATSASELFVHAESAGAIAFISNVKTGFQSYLDAYTTEFYQQFCRYMYGEPIAKCMKQTINQVSPSQINNQFLLSTTLNQFTLHGDPYLKLNPHEKPELHIDASSVYFEPNDIDLTVDSIDINVVITNLGKATNTTFSLEIERTLPNNNGDTLYTFEIDGLNYKDTITIRLPVLHNLAVGQNIFDVRVDLPSVINEQYDDVGNNMVTRNLYINLDGIVPIYPFEYAIIPNDTVTLKGSTVNPFAASQDYVFQIDTIDFEGAPSPFFRTQTVTSLGGVVEAKPNDWSLSSGTSAPLILEDSTVYFWRVALDTSSPIWIERSFQYIEGRRGWGQAQFFQFKEDEFNIVEYNRPAREFQFGDLTKVIEIHNIDSADVASEWNFNKYTIDGAITEYGTCYWKPGIQVFVIDPFTLEPWEEDCSVPGGHCYGHYDCRPWRPDRFFTYRQDKTGELKNLDSLLKFWIPNGYYVGIYSTIKTHHSWIKNKWPDLYSTLQSMGSSIDSLGSEHCFAMFTRKGNPASTVEMFSQNWHDTIMLVDTIVAASYLGTITTPQIGPAYEWKSLHWQQHPLEMNSKDSSEIRLIGVTSTGSETILLDTMLSLQDSVIDLETTYGIDAQQYPWLIIQARVHDSVTFTPAQLERWQLVYDPVPEAALNPKKGYYMSLQGDTLQEGENIDLAVAIENVTDIDMDSLLVHYYMEDKDHQRNEVAYTRNDSLPAHSIMMDTVEVSTAFFPGLNSLWIDANPFIDSTGKQDQLEQYHFNNVAHFDFYADRDRINPLLDVTFDGLHIMDGEVVSPSPLIVMKLDDENPYLLLDEDTDTSNFQVWVTDPDGIQSRVYFMNSSGERIMNWYPATDADNEFVIEYEGDFEKDGVYELLVQANDKSGNESGEMDYRITFEVINESTITEVMNYPNPFSTRTQFVFTLTGNELPTYMKIQIMTVSGRVVREIMLDELGPLRIGRNMTSYWWNGTDEFGDPLANGVYLYRVITKINGEEIEKRATKASSYFHKGFGKMYLMR